MRRLGGAKRRPQAVYVIGVTIAVAVTAGSVALVSTSQAYGNDSAGPALPAAKQSAIANASGLTGPSAEANLASGTPTFTYVAPPPTQGAAIRAQQPASDSAARQSLLGLVSQDVSVGALPAPIAARKDRVLSVAASKARNAALDRIWIPDQRAQRERDWQAALELVATDATYLAYDKAVLHLAAGGTTSMTRKGTDVTWIFTGHVSYLHADGTTLTDPDEQWQITARPNTASPGQLQLVKYGTVEIPGSEAK